MATGLLKAKKEVRIFIKFHIGCQQDGSVPFSCAAGCLVGIGQSSRLFLEEWRLILHGVPSFSVPFCSIHTCHPRSEIPFSKPKLISQLEQGEEPWIKEKQHPLGLCPGSKLNIQPCPHCPLAFASQQGLSQHVWFSHLPQLFSSLCAGNHLPLGKHYPEDQNQQQKQLFDQTCWSDKAEIQETEEDSKPLLGRVSKRGTSEALSSPRQEQPVRSKQDNTAVDTGPSRDQRTDLGGTDKVLHGVEVSGFGAIKYGEFGLGFMRESNLLSLQKMHAGETPYMYSEWGRSFSNMSALIKNQRTPSGDKPYVCKECGRGFTWKSNLITHQRTHSGEKPYVCKECGRGFTWKSNLFTHQRTHSGVKPYLCKECGQSFSLKSNLITHQRAHSGEKPYVCRECGHGFRQHSHLIRHKRTHSGEKPYVCREFFLKLGPN
ncbi:hypothetical protein GH733_012530 [Mirounga leonina]|nr:hypothetical protein GH733_012530 [Mirounga leonina]